MRKQPLNHAVYSMHLVQLSFAIKAACVLLVHEVCQCQT